jgi:hypothetical protein
VRVPPRIPRDVIEHHLKIYLDARLVQQKPRKQFIEHKTSSVKDSRSYSTLAQYRRPTTLSG